MTERAFHWFVLGGGLSPYTLALWERVATRANHSVTLAYVPREMQADFSHEGEFAHSRSVELIPVRSLKTIVDLCIRCAKERPAAIVCMGHSPIYNILISAVLRVIGHDDRLVFYMSDTNGMAMAESSGRSRLCGAKLLAKRLTLGSTFTTSFNLGFSNGLAHRLLGIGKGIEIPLLPVDFPESMEAKIPEPLGALVRDLPHPRLLTVARLVEGKNVVGLVEAFAAAIREGMPGSLTLVGEGPERPRLEPLIRDLSGRAILAGAVPFTSSRCLFGGFDGMVLASTFEPWGIVITEALGWGLPLLSSRQCGAGVSMALDAGDAVKLCGTSHDELKSSLRDFVRDLERHAAAAKAVAPMIRSKFGLIEVADALIQLGRSGQAPFT